jgi:hypothetical protein
VNVCSIARNSALHLVNLSYASAPDTWRRNSRAVEVDQTTRSRLVFTRDSLLSLTPSFTRNHKLSTIAQNHQQCHTPLHSKWNSTRSPLPGPLSKNHQTPSTPSSPKMRNYGFSTATLPSKTSCYPCLPLNTVVSRMKLGSLIDSASPESGSAMDQGEFSKGPHFHVLVVGLVCLIQPSRRISYVLTVYHWLELMSRVLRSDRS